MPTPSSGRPPVPIIVGAPRSGTTLLRFILDSHTTMAIPPETGFLAVGFGKGPDLRRSFFEKVTRFPPEAPAWVDFGIGREDFWKRLATLEPFNIGEGFRCFYRMYAERQTKSRFGDKTPGHLFGLPVIERRMPEARFIHLIRDGRDVALSWRPLWFAPSQSLEELAEHWIHWVQTGRRLGSKCRHYLEIRFERLVTDPYGVLSEVCDYLRLDFEPQMLDCHQRVAQRLKEHGARCATSGETLVSRQQRLQQQARTMQPIDPERALHWRESMSATERRSFWRVAGSFLDQLGYEA